MDLLQSSPLVQLSSSRSSRQLQLLCFVQHRLLPHLDLGRVAASFLVIDGSVAFPDQFVILVSASWRLVANCIYICTRCRLNWSLLQSNPATATVDGIKFLGSESLRARGVLLLLLLSAAAAAQEIPNPSNSWEIAPSVLAN